MLMKRCGMLRNEVLNEEGGKGHANKVCGRNGKASMKWVWL